MLKDLHKTIVLTFILLTGSICLQFQCSKSINCTENVYGFNLKVNAYPDKDSIHIGDTVWLEIKEPTTLKDFQSGIDIDYSGAQNLGSVISFHQLSSANEFTINAANKFIYALSKGTEIHSLDTSFERQYLFIEQGDHYIFKLGIVPKEVGRFRLFFSNAANVYRKNNKCVKAAFGINFHNTDQHYDLSPTYQGGLIAGGDYYFIVN